MRNLAKIILLSFLLLQVSPFLHLEEHNEGGDHEHSNSCDLVFHLNNFSADDSISLDDISNQNHNKDFDKILTANLLISEYRDQYFSRAPPALSFS